MTRTTPARILVLEDRPNDRLYLTTLLGYRGFIVQEAGDGEEGLALAMAERPDLVISDVLMPKMDGYEFVRRLRRTDHGADVPVIFYTATYHEQRARALAEECGVVEVMLKPGEPEAILSRVDQVLARGRVTVAAIADDAFGQRHAQLTSEKLLEKVRDLEASERRMSALVQVGQQFMAERDPVTLLNRICTTLREVTLAKKAMVALLTEDRHRLAMVLTSGFDDDTAERLRSLNELPAMVRQVVVDRRAVRGRTTDGYSEQLPWPMKMSAHMMVPLMSRDRVHGVIAVGDKIGADEFSEADEQAGFMLGVQGGIAYDNALLINQLRSQGEALGDRERTTEFALSAAGVGVYERLFADNSVRASKGVREILDVPDGLTFEDFSEVLPPADRQRILDIVNPAIAACGDFSFDMVLKPVDKPQRYVHARGQIEPDSRGAPKRLLSVLIDMTERRQLELQLRQAQKMEAIGQLAAGVAHDFNNLLTVIQGYSRFLQESAHDDEQRRDAEAIAQAGDRAVGLTRQLLAFSRKQAREIVVFDLNTLITDVAGMLRRLIGEHIHLKTTLESGLGPIRDDRGQIEQVLMNLVVNARDAMPAGGTVTIATAGTHADGRDWIRLSVGDTGTGMSDEVQARVFEPFFTTKPEGKGTGLGLATVFSIVTQSGGRIALDSTPGAGTTFTILLPPVQAEMAANVAIDRGTQRGTESILIVEDDEAIRHLTETILVRSGYRVVSTSNPAEAMAAAAQPHDMVVCDVLLQGGTGPDLVRDLLKLQPTLRILYVSGYAPEETLDVQGLDDRTAFLSKPFTAESLTRKIRQVFDR
jgi:signal transduction histidine kinase/DNA-binding response OmpR family regulator